MKLTYEDDDTTCGVEFKKDSTKHPFHWFAGPSDKIFIVDYLKSTLMSIQDKSKKKCKNCEIRKIDPSNRHNLCTFCYEHLVAFNTMPDINKSKNKSKKKVIANTPTLEEALNKLFLRETTNKYEDDGTY